MENKEKTRPLETGKMNETTAAADNTTKLNGSNGKPSGRWIDRLFAIMRGDAPKRSMLVNLVLTALIVYGFSGTLTCALIAGNEFYDAMNEGIGLWYFLGHSLTYGFVISLIAFIGTIQLMKWRRSGLSLMFGVSTLVSFALLWFDFEMFLCFTGAIIGSCALLWMILQIRKGGVSTWKLCAPTPRPLLVLDCVAAIAYIAVVLLPLPMAHSAGFDKNLYENGISVIDAKLNPTPFYSYSLYQKILLGNDFGKKEELRLEEADYWLDRAQKLYADEKKSNPDSYHSVILDNELGETGLFLDDLTYELKTNGAESAAAMLSGHPAEVKIDKLNAYANDYLDNADLYDPYIVTLRQLIKAQAENETDSAPTAGN